MKYSQYGLDEVKKSHDEGTKGKRLCIFCGENVDMGFSLCFSDWVICKSCAEHANDEENKARWQDIDECFKCRTKTAKGYRNVQSWATPIHLCSECIKWADEVLNNKKIEMTTQALPFSYSEEELIEFKNNILPKLEKANKELEYLQSFTSAEDPEKALIPGNPDSVFEKEQIEQMIARQQAFINNLNEALVRIENKTYGICRTTGKLIDKARLMAVPHATLSLEAKLALNKGPEPAPADKPKKERKRAAAKKQETGANAVRYSDDDLRNFKTLISNKIDASNEELKYFDTVLSDRYKGIKIEGFEDMSPEEVQALIDRQKSFITELESALDRVKKKSYGIDEATGELMPKQVLLTHPIIRRMAPTPERPSSTITNEAPMRKCRICGCTDDCSQCIEKTGKPCHWIDVDLCSACEEEAMKESDKSPVSEKTESPEEENAELIIGTKGATIPLSEAEMKHLQELNNPQSTNNDDMNFFQQLAQAGAQNVDLTMRIMQKDGKLTLNIMPGAKSVTIKPILVTGTPQELDAEFFKTIAPGVSEIAGIITNIEAVKNDLDKKKSESTKPDTKNSSSGSSKPAPKKPAKKAAVKKPEKKTESEIKPEVNNETVQEPVEENTENLDQNTENSSDEQNESE